MLPLFVIYSKKNPIHDHLYPIIYNKFYSIFKKISYVQQTNIEEMLERNACYSKKKI